jgi:AraC-like DNA-binding protein
MQNQIYMNLYIKNMVSNSCILVVKAQLEKLGIHYVKVKLGVIEIKGTLDIHIYNQLLKALQETGFEILHENKRILVERTKNIVIKLIRDSDEELKFRFSDYLSSKLNYNYTYLSNIFTEIEGITIQKYIIAQKIERVKELMTYGELNLNEIAFRVHYSSLAHLSNQFKDITGISPSDYKKLNNKMPIPIEEVGLQFNQLKFN